ncbi:hypothetical protein [Fodinicurvata sediminis]|uniref:hypothetical protein n=1 Tax=Fodinicurvata sediminis TaxID=1121832 RepID=UPI0003B6C9F7|nr:hypothetical protein [Fodinicurvata sediminis]
MTIETTTSRWAYTTDGETTEFSFDNVIFDAADIQVLLDGEDLDDLNIEYEVSGAGSSDGGTVTIDPALETGKTLVLIRRVESTQEVALPGGGRFPSSTMERMADRAIVLIQQLEEAVQRTLKLSPGDAQVADQILPTQSGRANKALVFDGDGNIRVSQDDYDDQAANAEASATAAANSASAASSSASTASNAAAAAAGYRDTAEQHKNDAEAAAASVSTTTEIDPGAPGTNLPNATAVVGYIGRINGITMITVEEA